ncbi:MAG TPA: hypothetical protein VHE14_09095 [Solirubrobacteraceae bacterium]|nr:hypothetical protein [Solirubrobacteraceae bacterium]
MSERLEARAEVVKLARLLSVDETELEFLDGLPSAELRAFREQATNRLFDAGAQMLGRVGSAARLLPSALIATIAQRSFGPLLCARAAGTVDTAKSLDVAKRLPAPFLADVTVFLDPRRVAAIIAEVPAALVVPVARELGARGEHVTMGRFLAYVPDHAIVAAIGALEDETMLRTAFVLEHKDRLDHAVGLLPPDRMPGILRCAADAGLWPEALDLLDHLSEERRGPIADLVADQDEEIIAGLVRAVSEQGIWDGLLPVVRTMSGESRTRLATLPAFHDPAVMTEIIRAAAEQGLWQDLVPLIEALPGDVLETVPRIAAELEPELLSKVVADAAAAPQTLPPLVLDAVTHAAERHGLTHILEQEAQ